MSITCKITGLLEARRKIKSLIAGIPPRIVMGVMTGMENAAYSIEEQIRADESIPQVYKDALAIVRIDGRREVIIGPKFDLDVLLEKGTGTSWMLYRCPKQKYWGGTIKKNVKLPTNVGANLELLVKGSLNEVTECVKHQILNLISGNI